jgi:hypothetical protein
MIQLRNVPDALHRGLKARAGMSLSDYLLAEIREIAKTHSGGIPRAPAPAQARFLGNRSRSLAPRGTPGAMIVLEASAAVDWLLQTPAGRQIETRIYSQNETLHTVHLLDLEVAQVLRRLLAQGTVSTARAPPSSPGSPGPPHHSLRPFSVPVANLEAPSQFLCLRCCLRRACRDPRGAIDHPRCTPRFDLGPFRVHRTLLSPLLPIRPLPRAWAVMPCLRKLSNRS